MKINEVNVTLTKEEACDIRMALELYYKLTFDNIRNDRNATQEEKTMMCNDLIDVYTLFKKFDKLAGV